MDGAERVLAGDIAEVSVWSVARSASDIKADLGQLGSLVGDLGKLGAFGELGRALPLLGTSVAVNVTCLPGTDVLLATSVCVPVAPSVHEVMVA